MKLCKDCKYLSFKDDCKLVEVGSPDMVHGYPIRAQASYVRNNESFCGKDAVYFKPTWWYKFTNKVFK